MDAVTGDILEPFWGLSGADRAEITGSVDVIIHNAADTSFTAHRDTATTNVAGVRRLIEFARGCRRPPLIAYMSTASNVGRETGRCLVEDDGCRPANDHFNDYTHSKAVGEQELRDSGLPVLTLRPTIVLSAGLPDPVFARQILWCAPLTRAFGALPLTRTADSISWTSDSSQKPPYGCSNARRGRTTATTCPPGAPGASRSANSSGSCPR